MTAVARRFPELEIIITVKRVSTGWDRGWKCVENADEKRSLELLKVKARFFLYIKYI